MIWWYKDIFIGRSSNEPIDPQFANYSNRTRTMSKLFRKLKSSIQSQIEYNRQKRSNQRTYRLLSQLDSHYLTDIGLIDEDLHLLSTGKLPERFRKVNVDKIDTAYLRLVSTSPSGADKSDKSCFYPDRFIKAA